MKQVIFKDQSDEAYSTDIDEKSQIWSGKLKKGDIMYIPKGLFYRNRMKQTEDDNDGESSIYI